MFLGFFVRFWVRTLRLSVVFDGWEPTARDGVGREGDDEVGREGEGEGEGEGKGNARPWVLAFFHGQQLALLAWPRRLGRETSVLVSLSSDGDLSTEVMQRQGLRVVRGSSSRGGARGLTAMVRSLRAGGTSRDAAFAVDGPRGPLFTVHPGALAAARHAGGLIVPLASASARAWCLEKAWDRFEIPWPFSRVVVAVGRPLEPSKTSAEDLASALHAARAAAVTAAAGVLTHSSGKLMRSDPPRETPALPAPPEPR